MVKTTNQIIWLVPGICQPSAPRKGDTDFWDKPGKWLGAQWSCDETVLEVTGSPENCWVPNTAYIYIYILINILISANGDFTFSIFSNFFKHIHIIYIYIVYIFTVHSKLNMPIAAGSWWPLSAWSTSAGEAILVKTQNWDFWETTLLFFCSYHILPLHIYIYFTNDMLFLLLLLIIMTFHCYSVFFFFRFFILRPIDSPLEKRDQ